MSSEYIGLLCIGDPHLASRVPGFRKDDYPRAILDKLTWALNYASGHRLLPALLGDLFHWPRDNANRLLVQLLELFQGPVLGIAGNHDCKENELGGADDALSVLWAAGRLRLLERSGPWYGQMGGRTVVGGTAWGQRLPFAFDPSDFALGDPSPLVVWLTHHDVSFPGYEEVGRFTPHEIAGVDVLVNGHIHRPLADVVAGKTTWLNPGNIARVRRSDADRARRPSVLRINVRKEGWDKEAVEVPCLPYEEVFHEGLVSSPIPVDESMFVRGLAELESLKTHGGAGLKAFLEQNLGQFDERVAAEIRTLAEEVYRDGPRIDRSQDMEELRQQYENLKTQKITAEANLKTSTENLETLKEEAREKYGTDDLTSLRAKLEEMNQENERKRAAYQEHLKEIETRLTGVEAEHSKAASQEPPA